MTAGDDVPASSEPRWLTRAMLEALHDQRLREHGGLHGVASEQLIESALARPLAAHAYAPTDIAGYAAAYAYGLTKNHGFRDGNKRTAFMAAYVFLGLNGYDLDADEVEVVEVMVLLATDRVSEAEFAAWVRERMVAS